MVLINLHSLQLLHTFTGQGCKLLPRFDGPFEIIDKVSSNAYRLRLPASFQGHPVINIAHLEPYYENKSSSLIRPKIASRRQTFDDLVEFEVDRIIDSKMVQGRNGRRVRKYRIHWKGYDPKSDTWETQRNLKNAPEALKAYKKLTRTDIR